MLRPVVLLVAALTVGSACGREAVDDPFRATTCTELVETGRVVAEQVLDELGEGMVADLKAVDVQGFYAAIEEILRTDKFEAQAQALGCRESDLRLQGCRIYQGLSRQAYGELARQYLAPYLAACS